MGACYVRIPRLDAAGLHGKLRFVLRDHDALCRIVVFDRNDSHADPSNFCDRPTPRGESAFFRLWDVDFFCESVCHTKSLIYFDTLGSRGLGAEARRGGVE